MKAFFVILKSGISMVVYSKKDLTTRPPIEESDHFDIIWDDVSMVVESVQNTKNETHFTKEHQQVIALNAISKQESQMHTQKQWEENHPPVMQLPPGHGLGSM